MKQGRLYYNIYNIELEYYTYIYIFTEILQSPKTKRTALRGSNHWSLFKQKQRTAISSPRPLALTAGGAMQVLWICWWKKF